MSDRGIGERLFRSDWHDGLVDLLAGLALLTMGIGWLLGLGPTAAVLAPPWIVLWAPIRRRYVEPRAGAVRHSGRIQSRADARLSVALACGLGALALVAALAVGVGRGAGAWEMEWIAAVPALLTAVAAVVAGVLLGAGRFYSYALMLVAAGLVLDATSPEPGRAFIAVGLAMVGTGGMMLGRLARGGSSGELGA